MPGKPGQSKLAPFEDEIVAWFEEGASHREIARRLCQEHGLEVTHNAVFSFTTAKRRRHKFHRSFLSGLDQDLRDGLMRQLVAEWTHHSTAIEGNTLTLGETLKVLQYGLTAGGKPLGDHEEVHGHARAIDILRSFVHAEDIAADDLFELHRAVMPRVTSDALRPVGDWKRDYNGTTGAADGRTVYMEYASPHDVPRPMADWVDGLNARLDVGRSRESVLDVYLWSHVSFVRIHPFFDGNGRMARLLANLPVMRAGFPPLMVSSEQRSEYNDALWSYQWAVGQATVGAELLPTHARLAEARAFFASQWEWSLRMVAEARERQRCRTARRRPTAGT